MLAKRALAAAMLVGAALNDAIALCASASAADDANLRNNGVKSSREIMATLARLNEEDLLSDEDLLRERGASRHAISTKARTRRTGGKPVPRRRLISSSEEGFCAVHALERVQEA